LKLAVIVPMLNEEVAIGGTLEAIRAGAPGTEIIVVDGGSRDRSVEIARLRCDHLIEGPRGRARQMNAGAALATSGSCDAIAFVHADTIVPPTFAREIEAALADGRIVGGRFDVAFDVGSRVLDVVAALINLRSRIVQSATGDQAIFLRREVFERLGGYADIELCEDVDLARRLRREGRIGCLHAHVITSSRRWRRNGVVRTIVKMWIIKSLFLAGVSPAWLKRHYADTR
jgi:rSAM/selenodomain-associated transferase 2